MSLNLWDQFRDCLPFQYIGNGFINLITVSIKKMVAIYQTCHQHRLFPKSVSNMDVADHLDVKISETRLNIANIKTLETRIWYKIKSNFTIVEDFSTESLIPWTTCEFKWIGLNRLTSYYKIYRENSLS